MGRKTKKMLQAEDRQRSQERRTAHLVALTDLLADKVEKALVAAEPTDSKELKQISSILKELMSLQEAGSPEAQRERTLHLLRQERDMMELEDGKKEVVVHFENAPEAWGG